MTTSDQHAAKTPQLDLPPSPALKLRFLSRVPRYRVHAKILRRISGTSQFYQLLPGDVILTGTPAGVGFAKTPKRFFQPGDIVEVEIQGLGSRWALFCSCLLARRSGIPSPFPETTATPFVEEYRLTTSDQHAAKTPQLDLPPSPALKLRFLSHGSSGARVSRKRALACRDIAFTRRFYEEFLGLEVRRTSPISLMVRLGGKHVYAVQTIVAVQTKTGEDMPLLNHNGLDVETRDEVDEAHRIACDQATKWGLRKISKPVLQHGTYSFYFWDGDDNSWEILANPEGGYSWLFEKGDLDGRGHLERGFIFRPASFEAAAGLRYPRNRGGTRLTS